MLSWLRMVAECAGSRYVFLRTYEEFSAKDLCMKSTKVKMILMSLAILGAGFTGCGAVAEEEVMLTAVQQIENFEYETALATLEAAAEAGEDKQMIARNKGIALAGLTRYEEAAACYLEALSYSDLFVEEIDYDLNYYLADAYEKMGDSARAKEVYSAILALEPEEVNALFLRGRLYLKDGQHELAMADFTKTVELDKEGYDLRIEIAGLLSEAGYTDEGMAYLQQFLAENEKKLSDYDKGRIYYYMGDYENAKTFLESAKAEESDDVILLLGKSYEQLGDYNYATSVYKNYLDEHTEAAEIYNQLGLCKMKSGEYAEALSAFRSAANVENSGMSQSLEFNQIVAYEYTGNFKQAAVLMEDYLKKYPEDEEAKREYEFLKTR